MIKKCGVAELDVLESATTSTLSFYFMAQDDTPPSPPAAAHSSPSPSPPAPSEKTSSPPSNPSDATTLRQDLVQSAISFLSSPSVQAADTAKKVAFLQKKGLNQAEIEEAFKKAGQVSNRGSVFCLARNRGR